MLTFAFNKFQDMIVKKFVLIGVVVAAMAFTDGPVIESILHNPDIEKTQLSGTNIRATGFYNESKTQFVVHFRKQKLHGSWQTYFPNNVPSDSGSFENNLPDGLWKTWYPNGQLKTIRNYSAEKFRYIKNDLLINHPKNQRYIITKLAQQKEDVSKYFEPDYNSEIITSMTLLGRIQQNTSNDNNNYIAPFNQSLHHGIFINYDMNGVVKDSGNYVNGLRNGLWKESDESLAASGFYQHGFRAGQWKFYDASGILLYTELYNKHGERKGIHYFNR